MVKFFNDKKCETLWNMLFLGLYIYLYQSCMQKYVLQHVFDIFFVLYVVPRLQVLKRVEPLALLTLIC